MAASALRSSALREMSLRSSAQKATAPAQTPIPSIATIGPCQLPKRPSTHPAAGRRKKSAWRTAAPTPTISASRIAAQNTALSRNGTFAIPPLPVKDLCQTIKQPPRSRAGYREVRTPEALSQNAKQCCDRGHTDFTKFAWVPPVIAGTSQDTAGPDASRPPQGLLSLHRPAADGGRKSR